MRAVRWGTLLATALTAVTALVVPAGPAFADSTRDKQWWLDSLDVAAVHKVTQGEGITVAVVDSGVDPNHPDLQGNVLPGVDVFDEKAKGQVDRQGHGTAMASLIAGHGHGSGGRAGVLGIAPKAKILPVTVMTKSKRIPVEAIATGIRWALDHGADVINVSISGGYDAELDKVIEDAWNKGVLIVASSGNKNSIGGWPAFNYRTVGVTGITREGTKAEESSASDVTDIAAPGEDIIAAAPDGRYQESSGTSDATAIVSGTLALIRTQQPNLRSAKVTEQILWTTQDAGTKGNDFEYGWGILDIKRAVTGKPDVRAAVAPSPTATGELNGAAQYEGCNNCTSRTTFVLQVIALCGGLALFIGLIVFLLVRRSRKKRRQRAPEPAFAQQQPRAPRAPDDDQAWQRPPGA